MLLAPFVLSFLMFNVSTIKAGLLGLVGYRQNYDPSGTQLQAMTTSESGLFVNDASALLTFQNMLSAAPQFDLVTVPAWNNATAYTIGQIVKVSSIDYICIAANTNQTPPDATYWKIYYPFTNWLQERTEQGIISLLNKWAELKVKRKTAKNLLSRSQLFERTGNFVDLVNVKDYRVGFEIIPYKSRGVIQRITKIGLQFTQNQTIPIKLFQSGQKTEIHTFSFVYTGAGSVQWFDLASLDVVWSMAGGNSYYLEYDLNVITGNPINGVYDYSLSYENSGFGRLGLFTFNKFFGVHGFQTTEALTTLGDLTKNAYNYSTNYGINLQFDVRADYTDFILEQKSLFATAIQKQIAVNLVKQLAANAESRVNRNINVDWQKMQFELFGDTQSTGKPMGLVHELNSAIDAIQFDTSNIDRILLPSKRTGVNYSVV